MGRVKVLVYPLEHLVTFLAVRPGENFLEFREAVDATAVLRWAGAFTGDARWVGPAIFRDGAGFDDEFVLPAVAEVVFVTESGIGLQQRQHQVEWPVCQSGVLLHRRHPGAGHPAEPRG